MDLRAQLDILREMGVRKARVRYDGSEVAEIDVEFADAATPVSAEPATAFVDKDGNPVDLDDGMPELGRDRIAEKNLRKRAEPAPAGD